MSAVTVHHATDVVAFTHHVMPWLMRHEAEHNVMIGLFAVLQVRPSEVPPYLAWAEHDGEIVGVAMWTMRYRLLLGRGSERDALVAFAKDLLGQGTALTAVMAGKNEASQFVEIWSGLSGQTVSGVRHERLYRLERVIPPAPVAGRLREVNESELELATDWWQAFAAESLEPVSRERATSAVHTRYGVDRLVAGLCMWDVDGIPVSMVGYTGPTPKSIRIGPVYTPPEHRGRGYASAATATLSQQLLNMGYQFVTLYTDLANPTSNKIYQAVGYAPVCDMDEVFLAPAEG